MRKLTSTGFRKCGTFGVYDFLKGGTLLHSDVNPTAPVLWIFCLILLIVTETGPEQQPDKNEKGAFLKNQPIYGDIAILVENLNVHFFTYFASIKGIIHKIVTRTEILALVSLQWNTNFQRYSPSPGDMPKLIDN